jgi:hypothetical protein
VAEAVADILAGLTAHLHGWRGPLPPTVGTLLGLRSACWWRPDPSAGTACPRPNHSECAMPEPDPTPEVPSPERPEGEPAAESSPKRSLWYWLLYVFSPALSWAVCSQEDDERGRALREKEERIRREHPDLKDVREAAMNEVQCPGCKATINPITGDGYHSPQGEPWVMLCNQCKRCIEPDT